jgi:hypothetical protein
VAFEHESAPAVPPPHVSLLGQVLTLDTAPDLTHLTSLLAAPVASPFEAE